MFGGDECNALCLVDGREHSGLLYLVDKSTMGINNYDDLFDTSSRSILRNLEAHSFETSLKPTFFNALIN